MHDKILIVDDEPAARTALGLLLRREGFDVREASDGPSAIIECASFRPDLILLDILMPGMDGFEVCRHIKATPETRLTPVVLITGLSATEDRIMGINAGADDFLSKPIDLNELLARTRSLLRLKQYTDELENAEAVLLSLAYSIEARDPYTHGHCERLAEMSARMGEVLGVPEEHIKALRRAGIVHDIGKVVVPDSILLKPGPTDAGRNHGDEETSRGGRAHLRTFEDFSAGAADHSPPSREARWQRVIPMVCTATKSRSPRASCKFPTFTTRSPPTVRTKSPSPLKWRSI